MYFRKMFKLNKVGKFLLVIVELYKIWASLCSIFQMFHDTLKTPLPKDEHSLLFLGNTDDQ